MGTTKAVIRYGRHFWQRLRRNIPDSLQEVGQIRRFRTLEALFDPHDPDPRGESVRRLLDIPKSTWALFSATSRAALLERVAWLEASPRAAALLPHFDHQGVRFYFPSDSFQNGVCVEYALADEYLTAFSATGDIEQLRLLTATLCRQTHPEPEQQRRRGDPRIELYTRAEVESRARFFADLPEIVLVVAMFYFAGVKKLIHDIYGGWLFQQQPDPEEPESGDPTPPTDPLGWWGQFFDACDGDAARLPTVYQSNFHTFCMIEVRRRKAAKEAELRSKLKIG